MTSLMVLAAGLGTRLAELTGELPKALVPVGDRAMLDHVLSGVAREGVNSVLVNAHHFAEQLQSFRPRAGVSLQLSAEPELLGTAGGLAQAAARLNWPVLTWNADILLRAPLRQLLSLPCGFARLLVVPCEQQGSVGLDASGNVVRLRGESFGEEVSSANFVGVALWSVRVRQHLPARGCLIGDVCLPWLRQGGELQTFALPAHTQWLDIGDLGQWVRANARWLAFARATGALGAKTYYLAPDAHLLDQVVPQFSLIGAGAQVSGTGEVSRCIVCPGAHVQAPLRDCVVLPSGRTLPLGQWAQLLHSEAAHDYGWGDDAA